MYVALHGRHHDLSLRLPPSACGFEPVLFGLDVRYQVGHRPLHHAGTLHYLRQEHLAAAEQVADDVHPVHEWPLDHLDRPFGEAARLLRVLDDEVGNAVHEGVLQPLVHRATAPLEVHPFLRRLATHAVGDFEQPLRRVRAAIEHDVLHPLEQCGRDVRVQRQCAGIHDPHVHPSGDGVVQEHAVDGLAHRIVAAE